MHGLINRSLQCFLRDTFGSEAWHAIAGAAGVSPKGFEPMLRYDDGITLRVLAAAGAHLGLPRESLLEDLGTYLVSHPNREGLRRLLRFGGVTFEDFLHSVDDLPGRARLAVSDLDLPQLELADHGEGRFDVTLRGSHPEFAPVLVGVLRAMADDYGALVLLDHVGTRGDGPDRAEVVTVELLDQGFSAGRSFELAGRDG